MCRIHEDIVQHFRASFEYPGSTSLKVFGLVNRWIQTGECKQLLGFRETVYITNLTKNHSNIHETNSGNGHQYRVHVCDKICHFELCMK